MENLSLILLNPTQLHLHIRNRQDKPLIIRLQHRLLIIYCSV